MARFPKFGVLEIDGEELPGLSEYEPVSEDVYYDASKQETVKDRLDAVGGQVSPGFSFGRSANVGQGTWLQIVGGVPSNKTGIPIAITNGELSLISVGNEDLNTFEIGIYEHEGDSINLTLIATVIMVNERTRNFPLSVSVTTGRQLAARVTSGSAKNVGVSLQLKGNG
jgi:phage gp45-like|tara:strand:- start:8552 stop:9058 length:507 start_codon:yes stop_codon:yes gene_type:complete